MEASYEAKKAKRGAGDRGTELGYSLQCVELLIMFMFYKDVFMHKMSYYCFYALSMFIGVYVLFLSF